MKKIHYELDNDRRYIFIENLDNLYKYDNIMVEDKLWARYLKAQDKLLDIKREIIYLIDI